MTKAKGIAGGMTLDNYLESYGVSRRSFLTFCSTMAATLALPAGFAEKVAAAVASDNRPSVIWMEFQGCTCDTEALLRGTRPTAAEIVLDVLSIDYNETIMAAAGFQAEEAKDKTIKEQKGKYILVVEGSIPLAKNGLHCVIGGRTALDHLKEAGENAAAIICVGTCSSFGGIPAAYPSPTQAVGVRDILPHKPIVNLPGCPVNVVNLTATIVHYLTFGSLPTLDKDLRPLFAYGKRIHDNCERRGHFDQGQYVERWGDEGHRQGWCLYKMGCKGPATFHNCPTVQYNDGQSWPVKAGHPCVGCSEPGFWDTMGPFYERIPNVPGYGVDITATKLGLGLVGAAAVGIAAHGVAKTIALNKRDDDE
jgi:hydrogenase small subunit